MPTCIDEKIMDRAALLLEYVDYSRALEILVDDGLSPMNSYLAVKAGVILQKKRLHRYVYQFHSGYETGDHCAGCGIAFDIEVQHVIPSVPTPCARREA